jgi:CBS domain-containing protein
VTIFREVRMYSERVQNVIEQAKTVTAPSATTVRTAAQLMAAKRVGAVMVVDDRSLVGIFTERDIAYRVVALGLDPEATLLAQVMTREPVTVGPDELFGQALHVMHEHGFRHLPVLEGGKPIGIVSARSALDPDLEEFTSEARRRKSLSTRPPLRG